ncbi:MAG TPA: polymer-forming cytoskeletal protein [Vicinamibacterales bacterium]|nr:polymer-forming cytoskeletal protein [Vicinamibacterales bacterium]
MRRAFRAFKVIGSLSTLLLLSSVAHAQNQTDRSPAPTVYRTTGSRVAIGRDIQVARDEEVSDAVVVVGGSLRVDGRVRDGLVVVGGNVTLGPSADVRGDVVLVGGRLYRESGAQVRGRVSDVSFGNWGTWSIAGVDLPRVSFGNFGSFGGWLSLLSAMFRIALLFVLMALVLVLARAPVARIGRAAAAEPGKAFILGLAAELLFLPALVIGSIGLIMTIIGIPLVVLLIPIAFLAGFLALIMGFTGLACRLGEWAEDRLGWRAHSAFLASAIGLVLIIGPTMLSRVIEIAPAPLQIGAFALFMTGVLLEFVVWTVGLGAALMTGFGRWSTVPPPVPPVPQARMVTVAG